MKTQRFVHDNPGYPMIAMVSVSGRGYPGTQVPRVPGCIEYDNFVTSPI